MKTAGGVSAIVILSVVLGAGAARGEVLQAAPDTLVSVLASPEPGDTVLLADGVYQGGVRMIRSGAKDAPITIKAAGAKCVFDGGDRDGFVVSASWVIVEGIRFQNAGRAAPP